MEATQLIKQPLITEKSTWELGSRNRYRFKVDMHARKEQIAAAIEKMYSVRVVRVSTQVRKGKYFRTRFGPGKTASWKMAVVQLHEEDRIDVF